MPWRLRWPLGPRPCQTACRGATAASQTSCCERQAPRCSLSAKAPTGCSAGQKRQRYSEARGECGEVAAALELLMALDLVPRTEAEATLALAARVGAMLTRLVARLR